VASHGTENDNKSFDDGDETFHDTRCPSVVIARMTKTWTVYGFTGLLVLVPVTVCATISYTSNSNHGEPSRCNDRSTSSRSNSKQIKSSSCGMLHDRGLTMNIRNARLKYVDSSSVLSASHTFNRLPTAASLHHYGKSSSGRVRSIVRPFGRISDFLFRCNVVFGPIEIAKIKKNLVME
jgi:hypothetical protein